MIILSLMAQFYFFSFPTHLHTCTWFNSPLLYQYLVWTTSTSVWLRIWKAPGQTQDSTTKLPPAMPCPHVPFSQEISQPAVGSFTPQRDGGGQNRDHQVRSGTEKRTGAAITAVTRLVRVNNCHPVGSKQRFLFTQHLAMEFTVTEHWGC